MKVTKEEGALPIKIWASDVEAGALEQAGNLARLPFAVRHIALMPDTHQGYGMPIGGVLATNGYIIPNAVGVDIGCGMCAVKTPWTKEEVAPKLKQILGEIRKIVPVGFAHHAEPQDEKLMPSGEESPIGEIWAKEYESALHQLGTLGGGNHFIEVQVDREDVVWVMLHSGSRNLGFKAANYYNQLAVSLNKQWHSGVPTKWELAYLPLDSEFGQKYLAEMQYCVDFAFANRALMLRRIAEAFNEVMAWKKIDLSGVINIAHNYAAMENHFGQNVMVHRKGATKATTNTIGIIPGSQGTKSYIVKGLGNPESFQSCSHGAGRKMGRKQAQRELSLDEEVAKLDAQGILHAIRSVRDLDEAVGAYKDIHEVMANQTDLVQVLVELTPLGVIKG